MKLRRQPLSYTHVWETLNDAAKGAQIGHVSSHCFRHTYRTWLDAEGTPVGVQQRMMRHADIRTTMNIYGDAITDDMRKSTGSGGEKSAAKGRSAVKRISSGGAHAERQGSRSPARESSNLRLVGTASQSGPVESLTAGKAAGK